jgi:hypothetical protein
MSKKIKSYEIIEISLQNILKLRKNYIKHIEEGSISIQNLQ